MDKTTPTLLTIPLEIRQCIYSHLLPASPVSHPLPGIGLTSVSHTPPTAALLNITPQLSDEILEYFYTISTWKLILSHGFNVSRVDSDLRGLERSAALSRIRKIELVFYCDSMLLSENPTSVPGNSVLADFHARIIRRGNRVCSVLLQAEKLQAATLSWVDAAARAYRCPHEGAWMHDSSILEPLRMLSNAKRPLTFSIGSVHGPSRQWFVHAVERELGRVIAVEHREGQDGPTSERRK